MLGGVLSVGRDYGEHNAFISLNKITDASLRKHALTRRLIPLGDAMPPNSLLAVLCLQLPFSKCWLLSNDIIHFCVILIGEMV